MSKNDNDKVRLDLIPWSELWQVGRVLTKGAEKYSEGNWKTTENAHKRYVAALLRHTLQYVEGELQDDESGESHLAHIICNALFLSWFDSQMELWREFNDNELEL